MMAGYSVYFTLWKTPNPDMFRKVIEPEAFQRGARVNAAGDEMVQLAGAGFSARVTNHADVSPTSTMCHNALMGNVSTG